MKGKHTCTVCGKRGEWSEFWGWFGSIALMDTLPADIIKTCSPNCTEIAEAKIKLKEWQLPVVGLRGPNGYTVISERKGY